MKNIFKFKRVYDLTTEKDTITFTVIAMVDEVYKKDTRQYALVEGYYIELESGIDLHDGESFTLGIRMDVSKDKVRIIRAEAGYTPCKGEYIGACYGAGPVDCFHLEEESKCSYRGEEDTEEKEDRIIYNMTGILGRVVFHSQESYIYFDTGEKYILNLEEALKCVDKVGVSVKIQVSVYYSGKIEVKYLGEYLNNRTENTLDVKGGEAIRKTLSVVLGSK